VAISAHLIPYSAAAAAQEAQILCARAYRHGGIAMIAGDINHCTADDPEIDWTQVQPYNRSSRCVRRTSPNDPWLSDRIVGHVFRDGQFSDVAAHLSERRQDPALRAATGKSGGLRVDQAHVTAALVPAIEDYSLAKSDFSDHHGIRITLDLSRASGSPVRAWT
jgi:endonuclease/exonuclease/phosphatase family metal-dependent hydrolase